MAECLFEWLPNENGDNIVDAAVHNGASSHCDDDCLQERALHLPAEEKWNGYEGFANAVNDRNAQAEYRVFSNRIEDFRPFLEDERANGCKNDVAQCPNHYWQGQCQ